MRYVSLFSGVEAATVAWANLGWQPLAFAEVEPFPCAVLAYRFPSVPNLGDVCDIDWEEFNERHGAIDVLIGGSPCQSFSIAGGRAGLKGESRLMYEYIRAVRDLVRASGGAGPRYIVWENVPGCLSSNKGRDFGCLLDELEECGYFVAWRTLDSQFTRVFDRASGRFRGPVPQRRRRVYLVGSLGGPGAEEILFERSCLRGDYPKGQQAREAFTRDFVQGPRLGDRAFGFCGYASSTAGTIGFGPVSMTLKEGGGFQTQVPTAVISFTGEHGGDTTMGLGENLAPTVSAKHAPSICMESGQARATIAEDVATTLNAEHEQPIVIDRAAFNQGGGALYAPHIEQTDVMDTLVARGPHAVCHRTASR